PADPQASYGSLANATGPLCIVRSVLCATLTQRALLVGVSLLVLVRAYWRPVAHEWPFISGGDLYDHAVMTNLVLTQGSAATYMTYPPGFHTLFAVVCRLSGLEPLGLWPYVAPALPLLSTLACYLFARRVFGPGYGLGAAVSAGLVLNISWGNVLDSMYPDLMAAQFLMILALAAFGILLLSPSAHAGALFAILGSSVALYHTISCLILAMVLAVLSALFLPYLLWRDRPRGIALLASLALLAAISVAYAWTPYHLPELLGGLLSRGGGSATAEYTSSIVGSQTPHPLVAIPGVITPLIVYLGLLGAILVAVALRSFRSPRFLAAAILPVWFLVLLLASRTAAIGVPVRLAKEMGIPLSILASLAFVTVIRSIRWRMPMTVLGAALLTFLLLYQLRFNAVQAARPSALLLMTPNLAAAGKWLKAHNDGGTILTSPHVNNALLAMSGYSRLQSVSKAQLGNPRFLEPRFWPQAYDAVYVYDHPADKVARQILDRYDVHYVALRKRLRRESLWVAWTDRGFVNWRAFKSRDDLYQVVFENSDAIIFRVKG
ncbi:MAG: hypothetical protein M3328_10800, partial [Chloroflexota bacterium]|nr:hypothetical protein [Chloroflexota bacterium]